MIVAGIVLYNPDFSILKKNIESIHSQVSKLILIDNNSVNFHLIKKEVSEKYNDIIFLRNDKNEGIAKALNQIMNYADSIHAEWVITLDQDSICPHDIIHKYSKYMNLPQVGILSPIIVDGNYPYIENISSNDYDIIEKCITSASLNKIDVWKKVGGFDEKMFIDFVDFEYSYRVRKKGYEILRVNNTKLLHHLGNLEIREFFFKKIYIGHHNAIRKYYYVRNAIYCYRKHSELYSLKLLIKDVLGLIIKILMFEEEKNKKIKYIFNGIFDSTKMDVSNND